MKNINRNCAGGYFLLLFVAMLAVSCTWPSRGKQKQQAGTEAAMQETKSVKNLSGIKVGYCTPSLNAFYAALNDAISRDVTSYGMTFMSADGQDDISKQIASAEDLLSKGVSVLILNPLDKEALVPVTKEATKAGVAVFIVDSKISPDAEFVSSIQANNSVNGSLVGNWVVTHTNNQPLKIALVSGAKGNPVGQERREGMITGIASAQLNSINSTKFEVVAQGWGNWSNNGGLKAAEDILVAHPDINVLLAENDAMAMGAMKAINEAGKEANVTIAAIDGQKEAYALIKEGKMGCTVINSPDELGRLVTNAAVRYLNGDKAVPKIIYTPSMIVTKENALKLYNPKSAF